VGRALCVRLSKRCVLLLFFAGFKQDSPGYLGDPQGCPRQVAIEKWRPYLQSQQFTILTDHRSLFFLTEQKATTRLQQKAMLKLMDLNFKIQYKKGSTNTAADALSRCQGVEEQVFSVTRCVPLWLERLQEGYVDDPAAQKLLSELSLSTPNEYGYSLEGGIIKYKGRIWVGTNQIAQEHILQALHASGVGGHSGIQATYNRVKALFAWPKLKASVTAYIQGCQICQQAKSEHVKLPGLLQPLPVPNRAWSVVCMDFIEGLPKSQSFNAILVVVDKLTKYAHFLPLAHPFTALTVAQLYFHNIYKLHGLPVPIISDRDRVFTSTLWKELFKLADVQLQMSSSYHPQTDGQTERLNQCLEAFLRCDVHACPKDWSKWISLAEYWYNTTYHSVLGISLFEALYGHPPRHLGITDPTECCVLDLAEWLKQRKFLTTLLQQQLGRAQQRMKHQEDTKRTEREFQVGEFVYLKLQPHIQSSMESRSNHKLSFKYYGPFKVLQQVGAVAYKLELLESAKIHPVIHVSQPKRHVPVQGVTTDLSSVCSDPDASVLPVAVLQRSFKGHAGASSLKALIQWDTPSQLCTWEDEADMKRRYQHASAWGQADSEEGRNVMTKRAI
jgi:hypothetical protein